ncbi:MAG: TonB family protein [Bacteroidales bacterium]|nr:TonB family protein [Bacteroidales bacterium]
MPVPKHTRGIAATVIFHGLLLLFLLTAGFRTKLPLPEEQGIPVEFGTPEGGRETAAATPPAPAEPIPATPAQPAPERTLTQEVEEAPAIAVRPAERTERTTPRPEEKPATETPPQPQPPAREVNRQALFTGGNVTSPAEGQGDRNAEGNQGAPDGHSVAPAGGGIGHSFDLTGRSLNGALPRPEYVGQNDGTVVIEITVDKDGQVIQAQYRLRGSTTSDETLVAAARAAALRARFDRKPDAPVQMGTITYIFKLQD